MILLSCAATLMPIRAELRRRLGKLPEGMDDARFAYDLIPAEQIYAPQAAEGLTNREIAHALYVTPKTIETHLANVYRKLGVTGKGELADVLAGG